MSTSTEKWRGTYQVARADSTEIKAYRVKGKFSPNMSMSDISDSLADKLASVLGREGIRDYDVVEFTEELV